MSEICRQLQRLRTPPSLDFSKPHLSIDDASDGDDDGGEDGDDGGDVDSDAEDDGGGDVDDGGDDNSSSSILFEWHGRNWYIVTYT